MAATLSKIPPAAYGTTPHYAIVVGGICLGTVVCATKGSFTMPAAFVCADTSGKPVCFASTKTAAVADFLAKVLA